MMRYGDQEKHSYVIGVYTDLAKAYIDGIYHGRFHRANKYEPRIDEFYVDDVHTSGNPVGGTISLTVAYDYAKLKYPQMFDDRGNLIEEKYYDEGKSTNQTND